MDGRLTSKPAQGWPQTRSLSTEQAAKFDTTFDVVVVGSGCAGLTTAVVAAKQGLKVLVVEKTNYFGGTTAYSGGGVWIPNNVKQPMIGINDDSAEKAATYLHAVLGDLYDETKVGQYIRTAPQMLKWLESNTSVRFRPVPLPDYHVTKPGSSVGRTVIMEPFDGRLLRDKVTVSDVRYVIQGYGAFGSMQADPFEVPKLKDPFGSVTNLLYSMGQLRRYLTDFVFYGKGSALHNGNALVGQLLHSAVESGNVEFWKNSPALKPIMEDGAVRGLVVSKDNANYPTRVQINKGLVLASGGFGRSPKSKDIVPHDWTVAPAGNVGDGIQIGLDCGASLPPKNPENGLYAPVSLLHQKTLLGRETGQVRRYPHFGVDRTKPGAIIVDSSGRRFANEAEPYQEFVKTMHERNVQRGYFIADRDFLRNYGMGMALPWPYPIWNILRQGYLISAKSIPELAAKIEIPPDQLIQTVKEANEMAATGIDTEFHKGSNIYDQFSGDHNAGLKNPNLGFCKKPPFYALPIYPGNVSTLYGLQTNENAQVLGPKDKPIEGLYAVGCDQNHVFRGTYPGGGSSIGPGMTFGYISGMHLGGKLWESQI